MVFSAPLFLFLFMPVVLLGYYIIPPRVRNFWLLTASLLFYAWGERQYLWVILVSISVNYILGLLLDRRREERLARRIIATAVVLNLGGLAGFKYANFFVGNFNKLLALLSVLPIHLDPIHLPIGISFFTFHALSYLIDVYRREGETQRNPFDFGLYIIFFPQLIAGPIIRYKDVDHQLRERHPTLDAFALGTQRFIIGLSKKVILANTLAVPVDAIYSAPLGQVTGPLAWLAAVCYTLQIYFDFSGYSDMALGLGHMFGFRFLENFNYPYIAQSITEFWRRWHLSLSNWFRDYLYIPLGGNRHGSPRTYLNLVIVFLLCGFWHGASWTFIIWGAYHGAFLVIERLGLSQGLSRLWSPLRHAYTLLVVLVSWVFFRANNFEIAATFLAAMAGFGPAHSEKLDIYYYLTPELCICLIAGIICAAPFSSLRTRFLQWKMGDAVPPIPSSLQGLLVYGHGGLLIVMFLYCAMKLSAGTYNPFIYFRF